MNKELQYLDELVTTLKLTNSQLEKLTILKKYHALLPDLFKKWMNYLFHYNKKFYVTSDNLKKRSDLVNEDSHDGDIFSLLDMLSKREVTGHSAIARVNKFIEDHSDYKDILYMIIDQDIKCNVSETLINKAVPNTVPEFDVALGQSYEEKRCDYKNEEWLVSRKLDGVRCIAIITDGNVKFYSRQGQEFFTLDKVKQDLEEYIQKYPNTYTNIVLDGELSLIKVIRPGVFEDDFQGIMKEIRKKDHTINKVRFNIFDALTLDEFNNKTSTRKLSERIEKVSGINLLSRPQSLFVLFQYKLDDTTFEDHKKEMIEDNWEGLIIRKDCEYKGKRSHDILKYKEFHDAEYEVTDVEYDKFPVLENGVMVEKDAIKNLVIVHKGKKVGVGSGLSVEQRLEWYNDPSKIIGKIITVKYFNESQNQNGEYSLRFPTLKVVHGDERFV